MAKSRSNRKSIVKSIKTTTEQTLPVVNTGLTTVGTTARKVASASIPIVEKGVSVVYGTMATGFDLGVKGAKTVAKGVKIVSKKRRHKKSKKSRKSRKH